MIYHSLQTSHHTTSTEPDLRSLEQPRCSFECYNEFASTLLVLFSMFYQYLQKANLFQTDTKRIIQDTFLKFQNSYL